MTNSLANQIDRTGTSPVRAGLEIDIDAVESYFKENIDNFSGSITVTQFKGGQSNPTYKVEADNKAWVIRRKPPGTLVPSAHAVDREYRILCALQQTDVPVPKAFSLCMDKNVLGTEFFVMEFLNGRVFWDRLLPDMTTNQRMRFYDALNHGISTLHGVDANEVGLDTFGKSGGYVDRQLRRWGRQYLEADDERIPEMDNLIGWLKDHNPKNQETSIVHGDLTLNNVIFHPSAPDIIGILDWELSTLGNPVADFAYQAIQWRIPNHLYGGLGGINLENIGIPTENQYLASYCQRTNRDRISDWPFYMAFSMFKWASIHYGIRVRRKAGTASGISSSHKKDSARPYAQLAWKQVTEFGLD
ncbi:MAG: phosphotransferase [Pseudomonadales bacterium]|nr:phosphotransferase [Pseudomonadales bacterium]